MIGDKHMLKTILNDCGITALEHLQLDEEAILDGAQLYETDDGIVAYDTYLITARYLDALIKSKNREKLFAGKHSRQSILDKYYYNPSTGIFVARKSGHQIGTKTTNFTNYLKLNIGGETHLAHRVAHFIMSGKDTDLLVDHIDGNIRNNAIANLRLATNAENSQNRNPKLNGSGSCIPGVTFYKQKWRVMLRKDGKLQFFGYFKTQQEAEAHAIQTRRAIFPFNNL
jgi:hypothetical protein